MITLSASLGGKTGASVEWSAGGVSGGTSSAGFIAPDGTYTAPLMPTPDVMITAALTSNTSVKSSVAINVIAPETHPGMMSFSFSLPESARTSAGVYGSDGKLIKSLWSNVTYSAGSHIEFWNGTNDLGDTIPAGSYTIKLLRNNVRYEWGLVGNTSSAPTALQSWDMQSDFPVDMALVGGVAYTANGYSEGRPNTSSFGLSDPQSPSNVMTIGQDIQFAYATADDVRVYFANVGNGWGGSLAFVMAYDTATKRQYQFPAGRSPARSGPPLSGVLDFDSSGLSGSARVHLPTGIAVQRNGNLLAVAHGSYFKDGAAVKSASEDRILLFDKQTGASLGAVPMADPQRMAFSQDGSLWVISSGKVVQIAGVGQSNVIVQSIGNLSNPLAIAVGPTGAIAVVDGGASQQVKLFNAQGVLLSTYGQAGGYADCDPSVRADRLYLDNTVGTGAGNNQAPATWVAFQPDGSFWIGDLGNDRALLISSDGTYLNQIAFTRFLYQVAADHGDPTRVFADWLEYKVDYPSSLGTSPDTSADSFNWSLTKNWSVCSVPNLRPFTRVMTMSNGRTYGQVGTLTSVSNPELVELPKTGPLRHTGQFLSSANFQEILDNEGRLSYWIFSKAGVNNVLTAYRRDLLGFDLQNTPQWGSPYVLASASILQPASLTSINDPFGYGGWGMYMFPEATTSGNFVTYNTATVDLTGQDFHLGGVKTGASDWTWKTSRGAAIQVPDGKGSFPDGPAYGGHDGIAALVEGNNILQGYDGQYGPFSSQWMHWWEDGLMIGQFGHPANVFDEDGGFFAGSAGNIGSMTSVYVGTDLYLYNSDESLHPGIHRWRISGLDTIHELSGTAALGSNVILKTLF
ncbi:hypothetical protein [Terriglobus saanensis]|uniref:hypothetical protein n=1 Tax=Terriglobus saanensis TaxID=870903 RepID=UPI00118528D7|nr:hypothetical protein [Terriglobus saanensis]